MNDGFELHVSDAPQGSMLVFLAWTVIAMSVLLCPTIAAAIPGAMPMHFIWAIVAVTVSILSAVDAMLAVRVVLVLLCGTVITISEIGSSTENTF